MSPYCSDASSIRCVPLTDAPSSATQYAVARWPVSTTNAACGPPEAAAAQAIPGAARTGAIAPSTTASAIVSERARPCRIALPAGRHGCRRADDRARRGTGNGCCSSPRIAPIVEPGSGSVRCEPVHVNDQPPHVGSCSFRSAASASAGTGVPAAAYAWITSAVEFASVVWKPHVYPQP